LGKCKEALDFATAAQHMNPSDADIVAKVESIKRDLQAGLCQLMYVFSCRFA